MTAGQGLNVWPFGFSIHVSSNFIYGSVLCLTILILGSCYFVKKVRAVCIMDMNIIVNKELFILIKHS